jgi:EmrB/QacA subfamily drug resistance transporter
MTNAAPATADPGARLRRFVLGATILASSLAFIDSTVVTVALPSIQQGFDTDFQAVQWVVNGYALMLGALILVAGGLGDLYGRRRIFLIGILLFAVASVACAVAPNVGILVAARVIQGIGAALLVPQSLAIITACFPREVRGKAIGTWAAASAATTALGPPIGGFLIDLLDWRAVFWINVPLAALAIWMTLRAVPESKDPAAHGSIDWIGSFLAIAGFGALAYGLSAFSEGLDVQGFVYALIVGGIVAVIVFVYVESKATNPIMPLMLFKSPVFTGTAIATVFLYGCLAGLLFLIPFELEVHRGMSPTQMGLTLSAVGLIIGAGSRYMGGLSDRFGPRRFLLVGTAVVTLSCALFALAHPSYWLGILVPIVVLSLGMTVVVSPLTTAVMNAAPEGKSGAASGVNNAASRIGGLFAVASLGAFASLIFLNNAGAGADRFGVLPAETSAAYPALESAFGTAYQSTMWFATLWAAISFVAVYLWVHNEPAARKVATAAEPGS